MLPYCQIFTFALLFGTFFMAAQAMELDGAPESQERDSQEDEFLIDKVMEQMNKNDTGIYQLVPVEVLDVRPQVVAGTLWHIKLIVGPSNCLKTQVKSVDDAQNCTVSGDASKQKVYNVEIWQKPWMDFEQITYKLADKQ